MLPVDAQLAGLRQRQQIGAGIADRAEQATVFGRERIRRQPLGEVLVACRQSSSEMLIACDLSDVSGSGAPDRKTQKMPFRTRRSFTRGTPRGLFGSIGLMAAHSLGKLIAQDSRLQFGNLESRPGRCLNVADLKEPSVAIPRKQKSYAQSETWPL